MKIKTMTGKEFNDKRNSMSNHELIELTKREISKLCETRGKCFTMTVPPKIKDTDMLLCEIVNRFEEILNISNTYNFDCWERDGKLKTIRIEALSPKNAKIIFENRFPGKGYDEPY